LRFVAAADDGCHAAEPGTSGGSDRAARAAARRDGRGAARTRANSDCGDFACTCSDPDEHSSGYSNEHADPNPNEFGCADHHYQPGADNDQFANADPNAYYNDEPHSDAHHDG